MFGKNKNNTMKKNSMDKELADTILAKLSSIRILFESDSNKLKSIDELIDKYKYINYGPKNEVIKIDEKNSNLLDDFKEDAIRGISDDDFNKYILKIKMNITDRERY